MLSFENDYSSTAAPQIVARMQAMANEQNSGYGTPVLRCGRKQDSQSL